MTTNKNTNNTARKRNTTKKLSNSEKLSELIQEIKNNKTEGVVTLENGQTYTKVDYRLQKAREKFGFDLRIMNKIIEKDEREVLVECSIYLREGNDWFLVQNGHAQEMRDASHMNTYNYVEIAETSAMGRALGGLGLFGNEFASINEIESSNNHQSQNTQLVEKTTRRNYSSNKKPKKITTEQLSVINDFLNKNKEFTSTEILDGYTAKTLEELTEEDAGKIISYLNDNIVDDVL